MVEDSVRVNDFTLRRKSEMTSALHVQHAHVPIGMFSAHELDVLWSSVRDRDIATAIKEELSVVADATSKHEDATPIQKQTKARQMIQSRLVVTKITGLAEYALVNGWHVERVP